MLDKSLILYKVRALFHLSTMVIHLGHIFISLMFMLYGPKLGCVGQSWFLRCLGLINASDLSHLIILVTHAPSLMIAQSLVHSPSIKIGKPVD